MANSDTGLVLTGTPRGDFLEGDRGNDTISGLDGTDDLYGLAGDDTIRGGNDFDWLYGGAGRDRLYGQDGNDWLTSGGGADRVDGGKGEDTVSYAGEKTDVDVDLGTGIVSFPHRNGASEPLISIENADFGAGNDSFIGTSRRNNVTGGAGNDWFSGQGGGDYFYGGEGIDTLSYAWSDSDLEIRFKGSVHYADKASGKDTFDDVETLVSGSGDDTIVGSRRDETISGSAGGDLIKSRGGDDTLAGGAGVDHLDGGAGFDTADRSDETRSIDVSLSKGVAKLEDGTSETLVSIEAIRSGSGGDVLAGNARANVIDGGRGRDEIFGGSGDDTIDGGGSTDTLHGGAGSDTALHAGLTSAVSIDLDAGQARFAGRTGSPERLESFESAISGSGNDTLRGNSAANRLDGGAGTDALAGGAGDDALVVSEGDDVLDGGKGTDITLFDSPWSEALELRAYNPEYNTLWTQRVSYAIDLGKMTAGAGDWSTSLDLTSIEVIETGSGDDTIRGTDAGDTIRAGDGANDVRGGRGNDLIHGGKQSARAADYPLWEDDAFPAAETLTGGSGNDTIHGGNNEVREDSYHDEYDYTYYYAEDRLTGGSGKDELHAGWAYNRMSGGKGADDFVFTDDVRTLDHTGENYRPDAMRGTVIDFSPGRGDRIVIDLVDRTDPEWAKDGEVETVWRGNDTLRAMGEFGYSEEDGDTILEYAAVSGYAPNQSYGYQAETVRITLEGYAGGLSESDIVFV
jgi:Ca2+-binding RTX toxin-like protein